MQPSCSCDTTFSTPANVRSMLNPTICDDSMPSPSMTASDQQRRSFVLRMDQALRKQRESTEQQLAEQIGHLTTLAGDSMFVPDELEKGRSRPASLSLRSYRSPSPQISCPACAKGSMETPPQHGVSARCSCSHQEPSMPRAFLLRTPPTMSSPCNHFVHLQGVEELAGSSLDVSIDYFDIMDDDDEQPCRIQLRPKMRNYSNSASPMLSIASSSSSWAEDTAFFGDALLFNTFAPPPSLTPRRISGGSAWSPLATPHLAPHLASGDSARPTLAPVFPHMAPKNSPSTIDATLGGSLDVPMLALTPQDPPNFGGIEYVDYRTPL